MLDSSQIKKIQEKLKELNYFNAECTGYYGTYTLEAVKNYQKDNGLVPDGIVGRKTWKKLFGEDYPIIIYQSRLTNLFGIPRQPAPYLITFSLEEFKPYFDNVKDFTGKPWSFKIYGHKLLEKPLKKAFQNLVDRNLTKELKTFDGCFNIRRMKGGFNWSVHSWGLAVDFNAAENPYGKKGKFSEQFIKCFTDAGFVAGAYWRIPDGMHFQIPKVG